jgi:signal transduction histidine kinase
MVIQLLAWWRLIMPTDLRVVSARKRKAQAQIRNNITMTLVWFIIVLVNLVLLFADQSYAKALELFGRF